MKDNIVLYMDENEVKCGLKSNTLEYFDKERDTHIQFEITENHGINILNSYEITDDFAKVRFLEWILACYGSYIDLGNRSYYSLLVEWKAHNILYKKKFFRKRTKDTGLDPKESWVRRLFYRMVCFMFNEK